MYIFFFEIYLLDLKNLDEMLLTMTVCYNCLKKKLLITIIYVLQLNLRCHIILFKLNKELKCS